MVMWLLLSLTPILSLHVLLYVCIYFFLVGLLGLWQYYWSMYVFILKIIHTFDTTAQLNDSYYLEIIYKIHPHFSS